MTVSLMPTVLWAQRKDKLFVTVDLQDCKDPEVKLENDDGSGRIIFKGKAGKDEAEYAFDMSLLGSIDPEASKVNVNPRNVILIVEKKESGDHWPRLLKERGKEPHVKVDWAKYIDQDEEEAGQDTFDFNSLPGEFSGLDMGAGLGGMGDEISDSDDEEEAEQVEPAA